MINNIKNKIRKYTKLLIRIDDVTERHELEKYG